MNYTRIHDEMIERAKHAFRDYVVWSYATPGASFLTRLDQQQYQASQHRLDSEGKAYFSVQVNEFHGPSVSGRQEGEDDGR
jgi:ABC-type transporter MlaC component